MVSAIPSVSLDQSKNNDATISNYEGWPSNVSLNRTLQADTWNTLCVPFDISAALINQAAGEDVSPDIRVVNNVTDGVFNFKKVDEGTEVAAGTPILVNVNKNIVNPTFSKVVIASSTPKALPESGESQFVGIYSPFTLANDGTNLFLGTDGYLYAPKADAKPMNGLRAYLSVPAGSKSRVDLTGNGTQGVSTVVVPEARMLYDLTGRPVKGGATVKGIYITNGKKIIVM